jgi:hypothetical protein
MKSSFSAVLVFLFLAGGIFLIHAQTNAPAPASNPLGFLTPAEQVQYAKAHQKALEDNPDLKSEGENLLQMGQNVSSPADQLAFREQMISHRQKLRQAMLKADPTLGPIFTKIDQHLSEMKAQQAAAAGSPMPSAH